MAEILLDGNTNTLSSGSGGGGLQLDPAATELVTVGGKGLKLPDGTAAEPSIAWSDDTNTGLFSPTNDSTSFSGQGLEIARFTGVASAVNRWEFQPSVTTAALTASAAGTDTDIGITITPKGAGNVTLGTMVFDSDQTIGAGQDNYVLTYDNASGLISLEASAGGGLSNVVEDTTPQLGGSLDVNGQKIVSVSNGNIDIEPNGTGNVLLGNFTFDADQTVGAGQDNYVMTYDNGTGLISLEAAGGGGGVSFPIGAIIQSPSAPTGDGTWLACDGSAVSQTTYSSLYSAIGHKFIQYDISEAEVVASSSTACYRTGYAGDRWLTVRGGVIYHSTNGSTWTSGSSPGTVYAWASDQASSNATVVCTIDASSSTYRSTDGGVTFSSGGALQVPVDHSIAYGGGYFIVIASSNDDVWYSTDGSSWTKATAVLPANATDRSFPYYTGSAWLLAGDNGNIYRTTTANASSGWSAQTLNSGSWISGANAHFVKAGSTIYANINSNPMLKSTDDGVNWDPVDADLWTAGGGAFLETNEGIINVQYQYYPNSFSSDGTYWNEIYAMRTTNIDASPGANNQAAELNYPFIGSNSSGVFIVKGYSNGIVAILTPRCTLSTEFCLPLISSGSKHYIKASS